MMNAQRLLSLLAVAAFPVIGSSLAGAQEMPDIRIKVSNKSIKSERKGDTRSSKRQLKIDIDNRDKAGFENVTMEWTVIARDIKDRKLSIAASGSEKIDIPGEDELEVTSDPFSFSKTEGKVTRINRRQPNRQQLKVDPDTGTRYAGYVVTLLHDGKIIAEASTAGMKNRVKGLSKTKKK